MRILVVDDDQRLLAEVGHILTQHGHSTDCVDSAEEAVAMVKSNPYDFVLLDYRMPNHDGFWFMKNAALPRHTKALLVTSYVEKDIVRQMSDAGISGYVMKPFDADELLRHLELHSRKPRTSGQRKTAE